MASKEDLRQAIQEYEPDNPVAANSSVDHKGLTKELSAVKRRKKASDKSNAMPVVVQYRLEKGEYMSWKFARKDTNEVVSELYHGDQYPVIGTMAEVGEMTVRVIGHKEGLDIIAGDLPTRETFDSRRIYTTKNGTNVVFKRPENGRIVLWSYGKQCEIMISGRFPLTKTEKLAKPVAKRQRKMTQKLLASYLIAQNPTIDPADLTEALMTSFKPKGASIGPRHGPHYLSLSRKGKLPEPPDTDPRTWE